MKFSVARTEFSDALGVTGRGLSARSTLPILSGVLISSEKDSVTLQSTDLEISVQTKLAARVEEQGRTVLPGRLLSDIVRSMPEAAITVTLERDLAIVSSETASFTLKTLPADDFPKFPTVAIEKRASIPSSVMTSVVRQVSRAVSRDETRAILTGVLLAVDGPILRMVATDSYRLAVREAEREGEADNIEVVVPGKALDEVTKLLGGVESVEMGVSENQIVFEFGDTIFITRRIEGTFPNYKALIPKERETVVTVPSEELVAAVKRVSIMAQHNTPLRLSVHAEDQTLSLSATTQDVGDASEDLMAKVEGPDMEIAFNHAFLMDGLSSITAENTLIELVSPLKPGVFRPADDEEYLYLLMPVRLS
jgi:DNA polymerase-3 subunit beta